MKNDPEIYKKAKGFNVNPQNINKNGRPKSVFKSLLEGLEKEIGEIPNDTEMLKVMRYIQAMNAEQLTNFINSKTTPVVLKTYALSIAKGDNKDLKRMQASETLLDRTMGKAKQITEVKESQIIDTDTGLSYEELMALKYGKDWNNDSKTENNT